MDFNQLNDLFTSSLEKQRGRFHDLLNQRRVQGEIDQKTRTPVLYVGYQSFGSGNSWLEGWHMVNEYNGSTVKLDPERHYVIGHVKNDGIVPEQILKEQD